MASWFTMRMLAPIPSGRTKVVTRDEAAGNKRIKVVGLGENNRVNKVVNPSPPPSQQTTSSSLSALLSKANAPSRVEGRDKKATEAVDMNSLLSKLNGEQRSVVETPLQNEPIFVIAGAGTGKTAIIVSRILRLVVRDHVDPASILCVTFTRKAAAEMSNRLTKVLGEHKIVVENLHRLALQSLQEFGSGSDVLGFTLLNGIGGIQLLSEEEEFWLIEYACLRMILKQSGFPTSEELVAVMMQGNNVIGQHGDEDDRDNNNNRDKVSSSSEPSDYAFVPGKFRPAVNLEKNKRRPVVKSQFVNGARKVITEVNSLMIPASELARRYGKEFSQVYHLFKAFLSTLRLATMDGLIPAFARLLKSDPTLQMRLARRHRFIFVDEVQDLNPVERDILLCLSQRPPEVKGQLVCVGDEDQSIYSFRSGDDGETVFTALQRMYPSATVIRLRTNYRCPTEIVNIANKLICRNIHRTIFETVMVSSQEGLSNNTNIARVSVIPCLDTQQEATKVTKMVTDILSRLTGKSVGILARSNRALKMIELEMRKERISTTFGGEDHGVVLKPDVIGSKPIRKRGSAPSCDRHVKTAIAYTRLALLTDSGNNSFSSTDVKMWDELFRTCWNYPKCQGLGKKTLEALEKLRRPGSSLFSTAKEIVNKNNGEVSSFPSNKVDAIARLLHRVRELSKISAISNVFTEAYRISIENEETEDLESEHAFNLSLVDARAVECDWMGSSDLFTQAIALEKLLKNESPSNHTNQVFLGTIHQAKLVCCEIFIV